MYSSIFKCWSSLQLVVQGSHRLENYLNLEGCRFPENYLKIKPTLKFEKYFKITQRP